MLDFHYVITIYRLRAMVAMNILRSLTGGIFLGHPVYQNHFLGYVDFVNIIKRLNLIVKHTMSISVDSVGNLL